MSQEEMPPLLAAQYRRLWLDDAHKLGLVAEILADVLGWQPTPDEIVPDALALAEEAAARLTGTKATPRRASRCKIIDRAHSYALN